MSTGSFTIPAGMKLTPTLLELILRHCNACCDPPPVNCGGRNVPRTVAMELTNWPPYPLMSIAPGGYLPTDWTSGTYFGIDDVLGSGHRFQNSTTYNLVYDEPNNSWFLSGMAPVLVITDVPNETVYESSFSGTFTWDAYLAVVMLGCPGEDIHPDTLVLTPYWDMYAITFLIKTSDDPDTIIGVPLVQFTDPDDPGIIISSAVDGPGYERPRLWDVGFNNQYIFSVDETDFISGLPVTRTIKVSW